MYQIGALRALDLLSSNKSVNQFDIYVGTSAGSLIAFRTLGAATGAAAAGTDAATDPTAYFVDTLYRPAAPETTAEAPAAAAPATSASSSCFSSPTSVNTERL